ncbi:hypothetical protein H5410_006142 [Solanum commersonii]|uniref:NAC domain-containing protein n=1 Tax=Solanum commersonii TaxID=4109 RepID=A0A9J6A9D0_SOLCO|nr:hypothetical protein H5410_006142 [Solanum commersonii]
MWMNIDDEQLLKYLNNFVTGLHVQCYEIRIVDLYGNKKPSQLFETTTTFNQHHHHVFTHLKKKTKNFNRAIVGSWKGIETS